jgi:hypothetical protein
VVYSDSSDLGVQTCLGQLWSGQGSAGSLAALGSVSHSRFCWFLSGFLADLH